MAAFAFMAVVFAELIRVEPVKVFDVHLKADGDRVYVEGRVKNTGSELKDASIEVRYFDGRGRVVGEETVALEMPPGDRDVFFRSKPRARSEIRDFTVQVQRGRNPYGN